MAGEGWADMDGQSMPDAKCEQFRCLDCGAWLSLGPSSDDDSAVAIEIRALAFAEERIGSCFEWDGWHAYAADTDRFAESPMARHWHAGWLARHIVSEGGGR